MVDTKTNEIPVAQKLFPDLDLKGRFVSLDARHTQTQTARDIVLEGGGDYLLTVKDNQQKLHQNIETLLPAPRADFPPWKPTPTEYRTFEYEKKGAHVSRSIRTQAKSATGSLLLFARVA